MHSSDRPGLQSSRLHLLCCALRGEKGEKKRESEREGTGARVCVQCMLMLRGESAREHDLGGYVAVYGAASMAH